MDATTDDEAETRAIVMRTLRELAYPEKLQEVESDNG